MFTRLLRAASAPRNIATAGVLVLAVAGVANAGILSAISSINIKNNSVSGLDLKNNSVGTLDILNNSLTGLDIKNRSLKGTEIANNSITGVQVDESTLEKVPSAAKADTATTATSATNATNATTATNATNATNAAAATLADKAKGFTRIAPNFVPAFVAADSTAGRADAPFVTLVEAGSLKIQAKCFFDTAGDNVIGEVYFTTTKDQALSSRQSGGTVVNQTNYLYTDSTLASRRIMTGSTGLDAVDFNGAIDKEFNALGVDGSWVSGDITTVTRYGTPTGAASTFHGTAKSCAFFGSAAHSGNA